MRLAALLLPWVLTGCAFVPGSADVLQPERDAAQVAPPRDVDSPGDGGFELDSYKDEQAEADAEVPADTDSEVLLDQLGAEGVEVPEDPLDAVVSASPEAAPAVVTAPVSPAGTAAPAPRWTPADAVTLSWGLRLVTTIDDATPPRAILGLPDGSEEVVKAGDLMPDVGVIVLAVGDDVVQLGQVTAQGDHADVKSMFLRAMFPGESGGR